MSSPDRRSSLRVTLSYDELAFAILDESHKVVSQALSSVVLEAVKSNNPNDWKKKICDGFTNSTRPHLEKCLDDDQLTDIYVICKILQRFIHDVAKFCGGFEDPGEKERLSLQTQAIETGRNWAFHGDLVSSREVFMSIGFSQLILTKLKCQSVFVQRLSKLQEDSRRLVANPSDWEVSEQYTVSTHVLGRTLLYRSFTSFQKLFQGFFRSLANQQLTSKVQQAAGSLQQDVPSLVKRIRKEIYKPSKESLLVVTEGYSTKKVEKRLLLASLDNIVATRNKLAHNQQMSAEDVNKALCDVTNVLSAFGLVSESTKSALERLAVVEEEEDKAHGNAYVYSTLQCSRKNEPADQRQHVLRQQGHFIGRIQELEFIRNFMCDKSHIYERTGVLVYGPAGLGKSYLATKSAFDLRGTHPRQGWVSCSSLEVFQQDLTIHPHSFIETLSVGHGPKTIDQTSISNNAWNNCNGSLGISAAERTEERRLIVFDDVCTATVFLVYKKIVQSQTSFIITTRSTTVKEFLLRMVPQLQVIALQPFSTYENWQLIMKKVQRSKISKLSPTLVNNILGNVLGNLPLCVNIYASLLALASKKKSGSQPVAFGGDSLSLKWKDIEDQFGDCLHVRGLTGVVDSAGKYLKDHPYAVFLLAKICSTNSERILWNVLRKRGGTAPTHGYKRFRSDHGERHVCDLCVNLLGVLDYLFSESAQEILEICRSDLEELGLINWHNESLTVNIHRLTLHTTQRLLKQKTLFLQPLVATVTGKSIEGSPLGTTSKWLSEVLTGELLLQVISRTAELIGKHRSKKGNCENSRDELIYDLLLFLENLVGSQQPQRVLEKELSPVMLTQVLAIAYLSIHNTRRDLKISQIGFLCSSILVLFKSSSSNCCYNANVLKVLFSFEQGLQLSMMDLLEEALVWYKTGLAVGKNMADKSDMLKPFIVKAHVCIGYLLQKLEGFSARNKYLKEAAGSCHLLKTGLTKEHVQQLLAQVCNSSRSERLAESVFWKITLLYDLTDLKLHNGGLLVNGEEKETVLQCASLLRVAIQEVQNVALPQLEQHTPVTKLEKMKQICYFQKVLTLNRYMFSLDVSLGQTGKSLHIIMQSYSLLEEKLPVLAHCIDKETDHYRLWLDVHSFVGTLHQMAYNSGLFQLAARVSHRWLKLWDKVLTAFKKNLNHADFQGGVECGLSGKSFEELHRAEFKNKCINVGNDERVKMHFDVLLSQSIWNLHDKICLHQCLRDFMTVVKMHTIVNFKVPELSGLSEHRLCGPERYLLRMCFCLCILLGREVSLQVVRSLTAIADKDTTQPKLKGAFQQTISKLSLFREESSLHRLYTYFVEAKHAFDESLLRRIRCRKASLTYWKELARIEPNYSEGLAIDELKLIHGILRRLLTQISEYLWKVYLEERNYVAAEWFLIFCGSLSKRMNSFLDSAKYGVEYVGFLKGQERWSEALQQCCHVEEGLVEHFGEEYSRWLPEAPNTALLRKILEKEISKRKSTL